MPRGRCNELLTLSGISRHYGKFAAVDNFNLAIEKGEFISLLGPSGCGKTTTLQMIAGLVTPTAGAITLDGREITRLAPPNASLASSSRAMRCFRI